MQWSNPRQDSIGDVQYRWFFRMCKSAKRILDRRRRSICLFGEIIDSIWETIFVRSTESFKCYQSSHRMLVEQTFGQWLNKFRILKGHLEFTLPRSTRVVVACGWLHNFVIDCDRPAVMHLKNSVEEAEDQLRIWLMWMDENKDQVNYPDDGDDALNQLRSRSTLR